MIAPSGFETIITTNLDIFFPFATASLYGEAVGVIVYESTRNDTDMRLILWWSVTAATLMANAVYSLLHSKNHGVRENVFTSATDAFFAFAIPPVLKGAMLSTVTTQTESGIGRVMVMLGGLVISMCAMILYIIYHKTDARHVRRKSFLISSLDMFVVVAFATFLIATTDVMFDEWTSHDLDIQVIIRWSIVIVVVASYLLYVWCAKMVRARGYESNITIFFDITFPLLLGGYIRCAWTNTLAIYFSNDITSRVAMEWTGFVAVAAGNIIYMLLHMPNHGTDKETIFTSFMDLLLPFVAVTAFTSAVVVTIDLNTTTESDLEVGVICGAFGFLLLGDGIYKSVHVYNHVPAPLPGERVRAADPIDMNRTDRYTVI